MQPRPRQFRVKKETYAEKERVKRRRVSANKYPRDVFQSALRRFARPRKFFRALFRCQIIFSLFARECRKGMLALYVSGTLRIKRYWKVFAFAISISKIAEQTRSSEQRLIRNHVKLYIHSRLFSDFPTRTQRGTKEILHAFNRIISKPWETRETMHRCTVRERTRARSEKEEN